MRVPERKLYAPPDPVSIPSYIAPPSFWGLGWATGADPQPTSTLSGTETLG